MFIDYLTVIMINLVAGSALSAYYLWRGIDEPDQRPYAAAFFGVGLVALITGLHRSFNGLCQAAITLATEMPQRFSALSF